MLVFEDTHWIDPTSAELLNRLIDRLDNSRFLLIVNARPEFEPPWARLPHVTVLTVNRMPNRDAARLVEQTAAPHKLPAKVVEQLLSRGQGNALFLQELTKTVVDQLGRSASEAGRFEQIIHTIPATLRDLLMERLDRLGAAKLAAQAAAVIGQDFDERLLSAIVDDPQADLADNLDRLVEAQIVVAKSGENGTGYAFRHALIQEAAYQSLLKDRRREYHRRIAESLERGVVPETSDSEPERVAQHYAEAGIVDRAIDGWLRSGVHAAQRSANLEAVEQLGKALKLVREEAPAVTQRAEKELSILIALGPALMATRGWDAPEVRDVYEAASRLARETGNALEMFPAVWGRWLTAHAGGEAERARQLLRELFDLVRGHEASDLLLQAHHAATSTMGTEAEFEKSLEHMQAVIALYDPDTHRRQAMRYGGHDPNVCTHCIGAFVEMIMGRARRSRELSEASFALAANVDHAPSLAHARWYRAELCQMLDQAAPAAELAEAVLAVAVDKGLSQYVAWAKMMRGWALASRGDVDRGLGETEEGLAALRQTGVLYHWPHRLGMRAQSYAAADRFAAAIDAIDEAISSVPQTGEKWYAAELWRIKASILTASPAPDLAAAESCLAQSIALADRQGARLWEARSRIDMALLLAKQQRDDAARSQIAPIGEWDAAIDVPERAQAEAMLRRFAR
jgi:predicted ATPase